MNNTIGEKLRIARENSGLSQGQAAKLIGFHRPTISEIEAGRRKVSTDELKVFADIYQVSIDWLLGELEGDKEIERRLQLVARELSTLSQSDLDKVVNLLSSIKSKE